MAEKKLSVIQSPGFSPDALLGTFVTLLDGIQADARNTADAAVSGATSWFDNMWTVIQRIMNPDGRYVYFDDSDADDEFSIRGINTQYFASAVAVAGAINQGPMPTGQTTYIWDDLRDPDAIVVAFGAAWPTYPHWKRASIAQPVAGPWKIEHLTYFGRNHGIAPATFSGVQKFPVRAFAFNTPANPSSGRFIGTIPAGCRVTDASVIVTTTFDGTFAGSIGDAGNNSRIVATGDITWGVLGAYTVSNKRPLYAAATDLFVYPAQGTATQGAGIAIVRFEKE